MIMGRYVKGAQVVEVVTNGMQEILPETAEAPIKHFEFQRREIVTKKRIERLSWGEIFVLATATGGTMATMIIAFLSLKDIQLAQALVIGIAALDMALLMKHLRREE